MVWSVKSIFVCSKFEWCFETPSCFHLDHLHFFWVVETRTHALENANVFVEERFPRYRTFDIVNWRTFTLLILFDVAKSQVRKANEGIIQSFNEWRVHEADRILVVNLLNSFVKVRNYVTLFDYEAFLHYLV